MKHALYDPVYVTTEHAFGEVVDRVYGGYEVHIYGAPDGETIWVDERDVLQYIGPEEK